jgi:hypothetical protein
MITFAQAREAVEAVFRPQWNDELGHLVTLPSGFETPDHWIVVAGAREALVEGDEGFQLMDPPVPMVNKQTGQVELRDFFDVAEQIDVATPVEV